jgi:hypothetical protein
MRLWDLEIQESIAAFEAPLWPFVLWVLPVKRTLEATTVVLSGEFNRWRPAHPYQLAIILPRRRPAQ